MTSENSPSRRWFQQKLILPRLTADGKWQIGFKPIPNIEHTHERMKETEGEFEDYYKQVKKILKERDDSNPPTSEAK